MKICLVTASLGNFDSLVKPIEQTIPIDYYTFTNENFPPRFKAMTPRLQAKIPKCFAWQMIPDYDYYMWLDGSITLRREDSIKYFLDQCEGYDIVVFRHPFRPDIRQECRYTRKGVRQKRIYLYSKYENELVDELYNEICADKEYEDDTLVLGGIFFYKNSPKIQQALSNWWYFISRYNVQDQLSFIYVLKKAGLKIKILEENYKEFPYISPNTGDWATNWHKVKE